MVLLGYHWEDKHPRQPDIVDDMVRALTRTEKIVSPKLVTNNGSASKEEWDNFTFRSNHYRTMVNLLGPV